MRTRIAAFVLTALLGGAAPASAATPFTFTSGGTTTAFGYFVGQYSGTAGPPINATVVLNCVDFFHHVSNNQTWTANLTNLGTPGTNIGLVTRYNSLNLYRQAAWLTTQYAGLVPQTGYSVAQQIGDIQATIWGLFTDPNLPVDVYPPAPSSSSQNWNMLSANYVASNPTAFGNFYVVSDVNTHFANGQPCTTLNNCPNNVNSVQEFIIYDEGLQSQVIPTPEPASLALVATGLLFIGYRARRKTKI